MLLLRRLHCRWGAAPPLSTGACGRGLRRTLLCRRRRCAPAMGGTMLCKGGRALRRGGQLGTTAVQEAWLIDTLLPDQASRSL